MKKNLVFLLIIVLFGGIFISSCSEDKSTKPTVKNLFPNQNGSYWIYTRNFVEDGQSKTASDSTVIVGNETVQGQNSSKYSVYLDGTFLENYYRYSNDSKLYSLPSELLPADILALIPQGILPQGWVVIADDKVNSWEMFSFDVTNIPIDISGASAVLNGVIKVNGLKGSMKNISAAGTSLSCQEFTTKISYEGKINYSGANIDLKFEVVSRSYFADNIGLVMSETPEQAIEVTLLMQKIPVYQINESKRTLVRYKITE